MRRMRLAAFTVLISGWAYFVWHHPATGSPVLPFCVAIPGTIAGLWLEQPPRSAYEDDEDAGDGASTEGDVSSGPEGE